MERPGLLSKPEEKRAAVHACTLLLSSLREGSESGCASAFACGMVDLVRERAGSWDPQLLACTDGEGVTNPFAISLVISCVRDGVAGAHACMHAFYREKGGSTWAPRLVKIGRMAVCLCGGSASFSA